MQLRSNIFAYKTLFTLVYFFSACGIQYKDFDESSDLTWKDEAAGDGVPLDDVVEHETLEDKKLVEAALKDVGIEQNVEDSYVLLPPFQDFDEVTYAEREPVMRNGSFQWVAVVESDVFKLTHDLKSVLAQRRNRMIDEVIEGRPNNIKYIVVAGGAAKEAMATYILSRGGRCKNSYATLEGFRRVHTASVSIDSSRHFVFPVGQDQRNLLLAEDEMDAQGRAESFRWGKLSGAKINFSEHTHREELKRRLTLSGLNADRTLSTEQKIAYRNFRSQIMRKIIYVEGGVSNSGFEDARQLGINFKTCTLSSRTDQDQESLRFVAIKQPR